MNVLKRMPFSLCCGLLGKTSQNQRQQLQSGPLNILASLQVSVVFSLPCFSTVYFSISSDLLTHLPKFPSFSLNGPTCHFIEKIEHHERKPLNPATNLIAFILSQCPSTKGQCLYFSFPISHRLYSFNRVETLLLSFQLYWFLSISI